MLLLVLLSWPGRMAICVLIHCTGLPISKIQRASHYVFCVCITFKIWCVSRMSGQWADIWTKWEQSLRMMGDRRLERGTFQAEDTANAKAVHQGLSLRNKTSILPLLCHSVPCLCFIFLQGTLHYLTLHFWAYLLTIYPSSTLWVLWGHGTLFSLILRV